MESAGVERSAGMGRYEMAVVKRHDMRAALRGHGETAAVGKRGLTAVTKGIETKAGAKDCEAMVVERRSDDMVAAVMVVFF